MTTQMERTMKVPMKAIGILFGHGLIDLGYSVDFVGDQVEMLMDMASMTITMIFRKLIMMANPLIDLTDHAGIGGIETSGVLERTFLDEIVAASATPDIILLGIGGNDP